MKKTARNIYLGFILFLMYSEIIFLYYFEDLQGALVTALSFCGVTFLASLIAVDLRSNGILPCFRTTPL